MASKYMFKTPRLDNPNLLSRLAAAYLHVDTHQIRFFLATKKEVETKLGDTFFRVHVEAIQSEGESLPEGIFPEDPVTGQTAEAYTWLGLDPVIMIPNKGDIFLYTTARMAGILEERINAGVIIDNSYFDQYR